MESPMAARSLYLRLSLVTVPVSMQPATTRARRIQLRMLNPETGTQLKERMVDAETEEEVPHAEAARGYEYEKGRFVTIEPEELAALEQQRMESKKVIELEQFVPAESIPAEFLATPYYLVPQDQMASEAYAVIRDALARTGKVALGRVVLSTREHCVAVRPQGGGLTLATLRSAEEVRPAPTVFADLAGQKSADDLVKVAEMLIEKKSGSFNPAEWRDRYQAGLQELIEAKLAGMPAPQHAIAPPTGNVINLMDALRRSIAVAEAGTGLDHERAIAKASKGRATKPPAEGAKKSAKAAQGRAGAEKTAKPPGGRRKSA